MKVFALITISVLFILGVIFNRFIVGRILLNKKFWKEFLAFLPSIILLAIIGTPVALLIFYISDSTILSLIALVFIIFIPLK